MSAGAGVKHIPDGRSPADLYLDMMVAKREGVAGCARCGGTHERLDWKIFERPAPSRDGQYTAWAACPVTGDPILFEVQVVPDDAP